MNHSIPNSFYEFTFRYPIEHGDTSTENPVVHSEIAPPLSPTFSEQLLSIKSQQRSSSAPEIRTLASRDNSIPSTSDPPLESSLPVPDPPLESSPPVPDPPLESSLPVLDPPLESSLPVPDQARALDAQAGIPGLRSKNEGRTIIENTHGVFRLMREDITKEDSDDGWIYILHSATLPGLLKIGRASKNVRERQIRINRCIGTPSKILDVDNLFRTPNHARVERLIHEELWNYEKKFPCDVCKPKSTTHAEWFEISEERAVEVVERWKRWMVTDPYSDGRLRNREVLRIDSCAKEPTLMKDMVSEDRQSWRWDDFMSTPPFYFKYLWVKAFLFGKRYTERSNCSRWESLLKHWKSNLAFLLFAYAVPISLSGVSYFFPFLISATTGTNIVVFGIAAILYAA